MNQRPSYAWLTISGWSGSTTTRVLLVGETPKRRRIRAIQRTKLAGRGRWLEPGEEALVPKTAVTSTIMREVFGSTAMVESTYELQGTGTPYVRDVDAQCHHFEPGVPQPAGECDGDGHYLCRECRRRRVDP